MAGAYDIPVSATTRRLALRMRPDLVVQPQQIGRRRYWAVKDPLALNYFHLRDEEHAILEMLDGRTSLGEIKRHFERAFAPLQITVEQIQAFLGRLYESGLLVAEAPDQGEQLLLRRRRQRTRTMLQSLTGILAIRLLSFDAEPILHRLVPLCRWMFSPWLLAGCTLLVLGAGTLVAVEFAAMQADLPAFEAFFGAGNLVWLAVALASTKLLHELAHALTCKHFGGECHELGMLLLVFTPCLYCNVSDSWMLPSKWQRIAITAAGICLEIVLAAICTFLWWFSEPGLLHMLCLNVMFICSVSTVLFNGNPLLRYDGYFILSDLVEVPNLAQQSRALVRRALARAFLGVVPHDDRAVPERHRGMVAAYGVASTLYRWAVIVAILWFCHHLAKANHVEPLAQLLTLVVVGGLFVVPAIGAVRFLRNPYRTRQVKPARLAWTSAVVTAAVVALLVVPLPFRVAAPVVLQPRGAHRVYVPVPGTLQWAVRAGATVEQGEVLAELEDLDLRAQIEELAGQCDQQRLHLANLRYRLLQDTSVGPEIPTAEEALADLEERLRKREQDQQQLTLRAPVGGTVLPPAGHKAHADAPGQLLTWSGSPLQERNRGCLLQTGTLFCMVGDPSRLEAVLLIDQSALGLLDTGQRVRLRLDELPGEVLQGAITEIAKRDLKVVPRELATGEGVPVQIGEGGVAVPLEASYQARVLLDEHPHALSIGGRGQAKVLADPQPLGRRLYRYLRRTFRFKL